MPNLSTDHHTPTASAGQLEHGQRKVSAELSFVNLFRVYQHLLDDCEQQALQLVELRGATYREVAELLSDSSAVAVTIDEVKMLIFTGRKKLHWGMSRTLEELEKRAR